MKYLSQHLLIGIWILVVITGTTAVFWGITHESIWYDESYTAAMTNHPLLDILRFSSGDFLTGQQTVWLANRLGLFGVKFEELSVGDILKTGPFSIATRKQVFWVPPGWYRVSVIRFARNPDVT